MKFLVATGAATLYGISLRLAFGTLNSIMPIMSVSFLILAPVVVGFITVLIYMRYKKASALGAFFLPWITTFLLLIATIYLNLEGSICWLMIYPLFSIAAGIGGLFAHRIMRKRKINQANSKDILDENQWNNRLKVSAVLVLPIIFGIIESDHSLNRSDITIERSITINKPNNKVWKALTNYTGTGVKMPDIKQVKLIKDSNFIYLYVIKQKSIFRESILVISIFIIIIIY